jgi:hypothetical protein
MRLLEALRDPFSFSRVSVIHHAIITPQNGIPDGIGIQREDFIGTLAERY